MPGQNRDVAQEEADPIGPTDHAGGTYGHRDETDAARRSEYRQDNAVDAGFQESDRLDLSPTAAAETDDPGSETGEEKAAHDLNY